MNDSRIVVTMKHLERGALRAIADVTVPSPFGEVAIRGFRVIQEGAQPPWVGFPSSSYMKNGEIVRSPVIQVGPSLRRQIVDAVLNEYEGQA